jgi:hypothetical protein
VTRIQIHAGQRPGARAARPLAFAAVIVAACSASACGGGGPAAAVVHSSPGAVVADWIHQVASGNLAAFCQDQLDPAQLAGRIGAECKSGQGKKAFNAYHGNFVIDGIKPKTRVSVTAARVTGSDAAVRGSDIRVSGTSLDSLVTARTTGIKPGQLAWTFKLSRINGAWYVTETNINVG